MNIGVRPAYFLFVLTASALCQSPAPTLPGTIDAIASVPLTSVLAGESVPVTVDIGISAPRDLTVLGEAVCGGQFVRFGVAIKMGNHIGKGSIDIDRAGLGGDCQFDAVRIPAEKTEKDRVIENGSIKLKKPIRFHVEALPRLAEALPSVADAQINPTEKQFFRTQATPVKQIRDALTSYLDQHAEQTDSLNDLLLKTLEMADDALMSDEAKFGTMYRENGKKPPVFFQDLHRRYGALMLDLRTAKTASSQSTVGSARLIFTGQELRKRPQEKGPSRFSGTFTPNANSTLALLDWHVDVYEIVAATGSSTFKLSIASIPREATVATKRIGEDYTTLGALTDVPELSFDFAVWTFKFSRNGCNDLVRIYNPVQDSSPILQVELKCK